MEKVPGKNSLEAALFGVFDTLLAILPREHKESAEAAEFDFQTSILRDLLNTSLCITDKYSLDSQGALRKKGDCLAYAGEIQKMEESLTSHSASAAADNADTQIPEGKDTLSIQASPFGLASDVLEALPYKEYLPWQLDMLSKAVPPHLDRPILRHTLLSAPTSAGKSLIATIVILRCLCVCAQSCILAVPFIALADEMYGKFQQFLPSGCSVIEVTGMKQVPKISGARPILYICTFEKAMIIFRRFLKQDLISKLGLVVFDEVHTIGDTTSRACRLELFMSQLILLEKISADISYKILGMSATLVNIADFQAWLGCYVYACSHRPVELTEHVIYNNAIYEVQAADQQSEECGKVSALFKSNLIIRGAGGTDFLRCSSLLKTVVIASKPLIVFVSTRGETVKVATEIANLLETVLQVKPSEESQKRRTELCNSMGRLNTVGASGFQAITRLLVNGIMYHNSSLSSTERTLIEEAFTNRTLHTVVATTTISAGVNLPCSSVIIDYRRVVMQQWKGHSSVIELDGVKYRQMIGRAGRYGHAEAGHSYLVLSDNDLKRDVPVSVKEESGANISSGTQSAPSEQLPVTQQLGAYMHKLHYLQPILSSITTTSISAEIVLNSCLYDVSVEDFLNSTLAKVQNRITHKAILDSIKELSDMRLIHYKDNIISLTKRGQACVDAGTDLYNSTLIWHYIEYFERQGLLIGNDLHLCCTIVPIAGMFCELLKSMGGMESNATVDIDSLWRKRYEFGAFDTLILRPNYDLMYNILSHMVSSTAEPVLQRHGLNTDYLAEKLVASGSHHDFGAVVVYNGLLLQMFLSKAEAASTSDEGAGKRSDMLDAVVASVRGSFQIDGGTFETLLKNAIQQALAVAQYAESLGKTTVARVYKILGDRLRQVTLDDLSDLLIIPGVGSKRARVLRDAGYRNVDDIVEAGHERLKKTLDFGSLTEAVCRQIYDGAEKLWSIEYNGL